MKKTIFLFMLSFLFTATYANLSQTIDEDIPEAVMTALQENFPKYDMVDFKLIKTKTGNQFEIEMESTINVIKVLVKPDGTIIKKEIINEEEVKSQNEPEIEIDVDLE